MTKKFKQYWESDPVLLVWQSKELDEVVNWVYKHGVARLIKEI